MAENHECVKRGTFERDGKFVDRFVCRACGFSGTLAEAIKHAVANQFTVRS